MARHRIKRYGTRAEVMNGGARMTQGRLTKSDLKYNEYGYIVSKTKSIQMKGEKNPLRKLNMLQNKKGTFGPKKHSKKKSLKNRNKNKKNARKRSKKQRTKK